MGDNDLLYAKGIFPYEWFDSFDKFEETDLPQKDAFYINLNEEGITEEEHARARAVWNKLVAWNFKIITIPT